MRSGRLALEVPSVAATVTTRGSEPRGGTVSTAVVGVTAPGFVGLNRVFRTDVWVTVAQAPFVVPGLRGELTDRNNRWFGVVGRLTDGAGLDSARAQLDLLAARWRAADARTYQDARLVARSQEETTRKATGQGAVVLTNAYITYIRQEIEQGSFKIYQLKRSVQPGDKLYLAPAERVKIW